jgi:hypothetical protein
VTAAANGSNEPKMTDAAKLTNGYFRDIPPSAVQSQTQAKEDQDAAAQLIAIRTFQTRGITAVTSTDQTKTRARMSGVRKSANTPA